MNLFVSDVDALYEELRKRGAKLLNEPNELCFGMESKR